MFMMLYVVLKKKHVQCIYVCIRYKGRKKQTQHHVNEGRLFSMRTLAG